MDSIIAAASVIAAGLSIGLSAIGPGKVTLLVKLLKVLLVNLKQKTKSVLLLSLAFMEALTIYGLVVALALLFNPFALITKTKSNFSFETINKIKGSNH
jgi:F-type H+-transporting ATPase subunit c